MSQHCPPMAIIVVIRERLTCTTRMMRGLIETAPATFPIILVEPGLPQEIRRELDALHATRPFQRLIFETFLRSNAARNRALQQLGPCQWVAFFDNDLVLPPGWWEAAIAAGEANQADFVVPVTLLRRLSKGSVVEDVHHAGGISSIEVRDGKAVWNSAHRGEGLAPDDASLAALAGVTENFEFHGVVARRAAALALAPFDEPSHQDDHYDLSLRALLAGHRIILAPKFRITYDTTGPLTDDDIVRFMFRWNTASIAASCRHFEQRWGFDRRYLAQFRDRHVLRVLMSARPELFTGLSEAEMQAKISAIEGAALADPRAREDAYRPITGHLPPRADRLAFAISLVAKASRISKIYLLVARGLLALVSRAGGSSNNAVKRKLNRLLENLAENLLRLRVKHFQLAR